MRLLILATTKFAPTYNSKLVSQVKYFNSFANRKADILVDASLLEIQNILNKSTYDLIYPTTVFEYNNEGTSITSFNSYLYKLLDYYKQKYIGSSLFSHLLLNDKALTNFKSGVGLPNKVITRHAWQNNKEMILEQLESFQLPAIIKPNTLAASLGIDESSIVRDSKEFAHIIDNCLKKFDCLSEVLVEYYLENCIEYTVSVTGNSGRYLFPKTKIHPIHSFQSKNMLAEQREFTYTIEENNIIQYKLQRLSEKMFEKMNLRDIENKLKNTIAQLEDAEKQLSDTHERIQLLKKQRVELEKFKKDYMTFEEKFRQYGKKNRSTKTVKTVKLSTESNKENVKEDTNKETKSESSNASFGVENMFNH